MPYENYCAIEKFDMTFPEQIIGPWELDVCIVCLFFISATQVTAQI